MLPSASWPLGPPHKSIVLVQIMGYLLELTECLLLLLIPRNDLFRLPHEGLLLEYGPSVVIKSFINFIIAVLGLLGLYLYIRLRLLLQVVIAVVMITEDDLLLCSKLLGLKVLPFRELLYAGVKLIVCECLQASFLRYPRVFLHEVTDLLGFQPLGVRGSLLALGFLLFTFLLGFGGLRVLVSELGNDLLQLLEGDVLPVTVDLASDQALKPRIRHVLN
jgi:hypothetical protein